MRYDLYKDSTFVATYHFTEGEQPTLNANKGRFLKCDPPSYDPVREVRTQEDVTAETDGAIVYTVAARPVADRQAEMKAAATALRYAKETGGVTVAGMVVATDDRSKALINGAYVAATNGLISSFKFKAASGWVTLTDEQAIAVGDAVALHVQGCFEREFDLHAAINAASLDEQGQPLGTAAAHAALDLIDIDADWPA